jgi:hypothetical protein
MDTELVQLQLEGDAVTPGGQARILAYKVFGKSFCGTLGKDNRIQLPSRLLPEGVLLAPLVRYIRK